MAVLGTMGLAAMGDSLAWRTAALESRAGSARSQAVRPGSSWLSAEDVAQMVLVAECRDAGVSVPPRFSNQAMASALSSVRRWTEEGRIFAIHDLYPRYQFDERGMPMPVVEHVLSVAGRGDPLAAGNWLSTPHPALLGRRPRELLALAPTDVLHALADDVQQTATGLLSRRAAPREFA